jgi:hypothetical protein
MVYMDLLDIGSDDTRDDMEEPVSDIEKMAMPASYQEKAVECRCELRVTLT